MLAIVVVTGVEVRMPVVSNAANVCIERRIRCAIDGIVVTSLRACPRLDEEHKVPIVVRYRQKAVDTRPLQCCDFAQINMPMEISSRR